MANRNNHYEAAFEAYLHRQGSLIQKFFLHLSKEEQRTRFLARLDDPDKYWKISPADFKERRYWDAYQDAYEKAIEHTSRKHAPWYIIPSDYKWYRNVVISDILVKTLRDLKLKYPKPKIDIPKLKRSI